MDDSTCAAVHSAAIQSIRFWKSHGLEYGSDCAVFMNAEMKGCVFPGEEAGERGLMHVANATK
jgi:hypothetical protein